MGAGVSGVSEEGSDTSGGGGGGGGRGQGECSSQCEDAAGRTPLSLRTHWGEKGGIGSTGGFRFFFFLKSNYFFLTFSNTERLPNFSDITSLLKVSQLGSFPPELANKWRLGVGNIRRDSTLGGLALSRNSIYRIWRGCLSRLAGWCGNVET